MSSKARKREIIFTYLRNIAGAIVSLPISLLVVTGVILIVLLLLPVIWAIMILWWVNGFRQTLIGVEPLEEIECECEDGSHKHA